MSQSRPRVARRPRLGTMVGAAALTFASLGMVAATPATAAPASGSAAAVTSTCPAETGNAAYVRYLYMTILNRCDDAGAAGWVARLNAGASRSTIADQIDMSHENLDNNNVVGIYGEVLKRVPSAAELTAGEQSIAGCRCDAHLIATLASSAEFYAALPGADAAAKDSAWLGIALTAILDRAPSTPGPDTYWGQKLGVPSTAASRYRVAMYLEHSTENAESWVGGIYFVALNRAPRPDRFVYWVNYLKGPGQWRTFRLYTTFLGTQEAYNLAQKNLPFPPAEAQRVFAKARW